MIDLDIFEYEHHGAIVSVRKSLKGRYRDFCLCNICKKFKPGKIDNCKKAQRLYELCVDEDMVTPVFECRADWFEKQE